MVNISEEELRRFVKANAHRSETITRGKNFKVFKNYRLYGEVVNVISFHDRHFAVEEITCKKVRYIEMNDYLLSIPSLSGMENYLFFLGGACYNTQDGTRTYTGKVIADSCYVGRFVVIDGRMLALCDKSIRAFYHCRRAAAGNPVVYRRADTAQYAAFRQTSGGFAEFLRGKLGNPQRDYDKARYAGSSGVSAVLCVETFPFDQSRH